MKGRDRHLMKQLSHVSHTAIAAIAAFTALHAAAFASGGAAPRH
jgi:hypothetical protein